MALAVVAFIGMTLVLRLAVPLREAIGPHWVVPGIEMALLVVLLAASPDDAGPSRFRPGNGRPGDSTRWVGWLAGWTGIRRRRGCRRRSGRRSARASMAVTRSGPSPPGSNGPPRRFRVRSTPTAAGTPIAGGGLIDAPVTRHDDPRSPSWPAALGCEPRSRRGSKRSCGHRRASQPSCASSSRTIRSCGCRPRPSTSPFTCRVERRCARSSLPVSAPGEPTAATAPVLSVAAGSPTWSTSPNALPRSRTAPFPATGKATSSSARTTPPRSAPPWNAPPATCCSCTSRATTPPIPSAPRSPPRSRRYPSTPSGQSPGTQRRMHRPLALLSPETVALATVSGDKTRSAALAPGQVGRDAA